MKNTVPRPFEIYGASSPRRINTATDGGVSSQ